MEKKYKVIYGGWHQRTTLHMAEIYEFLKTGASELNLSRADLKKYWNALKVKEVKKRNDYFDFLEVETDFGITLRYFEDGLYLLETYSDNINLARKSLQDYYNDRLSPAISYIFSLGAPTANRLVESRVHPCIAIASVSDLKNFKFPENELGQPTGEVKSSNTSIYKTDDIALIAASNQELKTADNLAELQIFLSEFQYQLRSYLNLHRKVWEDISKIKNKKKIKGKEVDKIRDRLSGFEKIIGVVSSRIEQMDIFIASRANMAESLDLKEKMEKYFGFKFNTLVDTLKYSQKVWKMTEDYLRSAIDSIVEIQEQSTSRGIRSLQFVTSIGIIAGIIGYLSTKELPQLTPEGTLYLVLIIAVTWIVNIAINRIYQSRKYQIKSEDKNLKV